MSFEMRTDGRYAILSELAKHIAITTSHSQEDAYRLVCTAFENYGHEVSLAVLEARRQLAMLNVPVKVWENIIRAYDAQVQKGRAAAKSQNFAIQGAWSNKWLGEEFIPIPTREWPKFKREYLGQWGTNDNSYFVMEKEEDAKMAYASKWLMDDQIWKSTAGSVKIVNMTNEHLINTVVFLEKHAYQYKTSFDVQVTELPLADIQLLKMAGYVPGRAEFVKSIWAKDSVEWMRETPTYRALMAEVEKRDLYDLVQIVIKRTAANENWGK